MKYELIRNGYGDPCAVRQGDKVLHFTTNGKEIVDALDKAALFDEAWDALPVHIQEACEPDHAGDLMHAIGLLRRKATLFDVLAARSCIWYKDKNKLFVYDDNGHEFCYEAPTLAEAIEAAMATEGEAK